MNYYTMLVQIIPLTVIGIILIRCSDNKNHEIPFISMSESQITFSPKTHALDNNDNFSPDGKYLCYDTRGTVFSTDIANTKSIEKVEISTGKETILWNPLGVSGKKAAPGVAAVSWHPSQNKVVFIHGPLLEEVASRGYYDKPNRTGVEVSADGKKEITKVDMRDVVTTRATVPGAHRGGTHRHEYSRNGKRIGFTYDDFLLRQYDRTIGYLEIHPGAPKGYTHYFALFVKPAEKGKSLPGEIEKAYDDSWVDSEGRKRAFIAKIRSEDGVEYDTALCVAEITEKVDITTAIPGSATEYPIPPQGIRISRITHSGWAGGIVRGSPDGHQIAYLCRDKNGINQICVVAADGSDKNSDPSKKPRQVTRLRQYATNVRWHPSGKWILCLSSGNVLAACVEEGSSFGRMFWLTQDNSNREGLAVSPDGNTLAYVIRRPTKNKEGHLVKDVEGKNFRQIFIMDVAWDKIF